MDLCLFSREPGVCPASACPHAGPQINPAEFQGWGEFGAHRDRKACPKGDRKHQTRTSLRSANQSSTDGPRDIEQAAHGDRGPGPAHMNKNPVQSQRQGQGSAGIPNLFTRPELSSQNSGTTPQRAKWLCLLCIRPPLHRSSHPLAPCFFLLLHLCFATVLLFPEPAA